MANILASHSLNEPALKAHVQLYRTIMLGDSPLPRTERKAIAVAVSAANDCLYRMVPRLTPAREPSSSLRAN